MGPLLPDRGSRRARLQRRARSISVELVAFAAVTLLPPLLLGAAVVVDAVRFVVRRRPFLAVRGRRAAAVRPALRGRGLRRRGPGPVLILMRHASIVDNALPDALVGRRHDMGLRFVLKQELEMLPTIDIGGRWVPTSFVRRGSGDTAAELDELRQLAPDLDPHVAGTWLRRLRARLGHLERRPRRLDDPRALRALPGRLTRRRRDPAAGAGRAPRRAS